MLRSLVAPDSSASGLWYEEAGGLETLPVPRPPCRFLGAFAALASRPPPSEPLLGAAPRGPAVTAPPGRTMPRKLLLLPPLSVSSAFRAPRACPAARPAMNAARNGYRVFSANSTAACTELAKRITE